MSEARYPEQQEHICTGEEQGTTDMPELQPGEAYLTFWLLKTSRENSSYHPKGGKITNGEWCEKEVERLLKAGVAARVVERILPNGQVSVAIVRGGGVKRKRR